MSVMPAIQVPARARKLVLGFNENGVAFVAAIVLVLGAVFWAGLGPQTEHTDFSMTYVGARIMHLGRSARLYDLKEQVALRKSTFRDPSPLLFEHPPFEALIFAPLAALPYRTAYIVWALMNAVIWLSLPFLLRPYAPVPRETLGYLALWLLFAPLGVALFQGQSSMALLLLYTLCFVQLKRGHALTAGICLGLGLFKFQFVLPFALIFLLRRQWRFLAGFTLSGALLGLLSVGAVGWRGVLGYVRFLAVVAGDSKNVSYGAAVDMATLHGFFNALLGHTLNTRAIGYLVAAVSLGLVAFTAWRWQRHADPEGPEASSSRKRADDLMFAAAVAVSLATGFHMFTHDFSPLVLSLFLVAAHLPARSRPAARYLMIAALALFWTPPLFFALLARHSSYLIFPLLMAFAFGALYLAAWPSAAAAAASPALVPRMAPERIPS